MTGLEHNLSTKLGKRADNRHMMISAAVTLLLSGLRAWPEEFVGQEHLGLSTDQTPSQRIQTISERPNRLKRRDSNPQRIIFTCSLPAQSLWPPVMAVK